MKRLWGIRHVRWLWLAHALDRHVRRCQELGLGWFASAEDLNYLEQVWNGTDKGDLQGTMGKQTPTPGPWRVEVKASGSPDRVGIWAGNYFLASVGSFDHSHKTIEANAKLMAAAPDLLRTIRELVELGGPDQDDQFTKEGVRAFRDAEALLEKHGG